MQVLHVPFLWTIVLFLASGVKNHYRVFYTNRAAAMAAIKVIQGNDEAIRKTSPTDSFRLDLPWVPKAPKASSPPPPSAPTSVLPTPTGLRLFGLVSVSVSLEPPRGENVEEVAETAGLNEPGFPVPGVI